nr:type I restriction-modification system subunit M N-terminal domain-containing protein [Thermoflexus sp.]
MGTLPMSFRLDLPALESWLWEAACVIRGPVDAPRFKDYILPLIFLKRLSDVFEDEIESLAEEFGDRAEAERLVERDHKLVRFYLPPPRPAGPTFDKGGSAWASISPT